MALKSSIQKSEPLPADVQRLRESIGNVPIQYQRELYDNLNAVLESQKRRKRILALVQDALSQIRLDMKYLMFDLEATRRERDELREGKI